MTVCGGVVESNGASPSACTGANAVVNNVVSTTKTHTLSGTAMERWAKNLLLDIGSKAGATKSEVRSMFKSTFSVEASFRQIPSLLMAALAMASAGSVSLRVVLYNAVNWQFHYLLGQRYTIQAFFLSSVFGFAASYFSGMYVSWMQLRAKESGVVSNVEYIAMLVQMDTTTLTLWLMRDKTGRYGLAYDLATIIRQASVKKPAVEKELQRILQMAATKEDYADYILMLDALDEVLLLYGNVGGLEWNNKALTQLYKRQAAAKVEDVDTPSREEVGLGVHKAFLQWPVKVDNVYLPSATDNQMLLLDFEEALT